MSENEFEQFLHTNIPITEAMGISVTEFTKSRVILAAKLKPNINDKLTAFGGSINTLMTICGWSMVFVNIKEIDPKAQIVIKKSNINYRAPIREDFTAECEIFGDETRREFLETYTKHNKSRLDLKVVIKNKETVFAEYEGQYVVFK
ncbi:thioesterase [Clostridium sp. 2-1]|uniref:YiiD C-terminal domain-containing protein n=1 Tax=Candidatus Clostridium helianthi TaxID=3381660 RepID=A0ABW8S262_9CLOT|nr:MULTISPECIES: YiiD C-terminal domain-containing protein [Clostridium]MBN7572562.1 thioesterase domain-containing protein [Clostridium beijerinckii]MBN7577505.1 thioesterase domain-containing protein [Clostridium beijerinckii]MBN7582335.1 thioesterase domain-containing protein [Clostridium beijerinckii]MBO0518681.1 thioesterase domain-containing protein [Clostridium beijerinckii]POO93040.1 thioesterase [Clostridium sp. 2-1]